MITGIIGIGTGRLSAPAAEIPGTSVVLGSASGVVKPWSRRSLRISSRWTDESSWTNFKLKGRTLSQAKKEVASNSGDIDSYSNPKGSSAVATEPSARAKKAMV
jgi:hypothetical protein